MASRVRVWRESVVIPTYAVGTPDRNPMFLEKRVYQGSSGAIYPYQVTDSISDVRCDVAYQAVYLENDYLKVMILPELGGRVQMALDKTNNYHFVYHNEVIKPALVGLAGPWISGGIEFNWPQHHRPSTFSPVQCDIVVDDEGMATVWCNEIDRMHGTRGMHGFRLRPGKAFLEIEVKLFNRTELPQTFLWWANPAIHVDDYHQSIFPRDVHAVFDHGKRDVSEFPNATGTYYKVDYSPGTDISRYRNIPVPTSYMAFHSDYDFVGSYDHRRKAGLLHVASHHISPGKKQWTWGTGDFGKAWDRQLTDGNGPYIELMCGVYTDNQPDFTWLMPGEEKTFTQHFMPYKGVGRVCNANTDGAIGLERREGQLRLSAYTTSDMPQATLQLWHENHQLHSATFDGSPSDSFEMLVPEPEGIPLEALRLVLVDRQGVKVVAFHAESAPLPVPEAARAIPAPEQVDSLESLYLAGLHLEQYRHATRNPLDYYHEALRRDPGDSRSNNAVGRLLYRRGRFELAEPHFRRAIERLTRHNLSPYDDEARYNLGLCLAQMGRREEAFDVLYKATWCGPMASRAYMELARLAAMQQDYQTGLELAERALELGPRDQQAVQVQVTCLVELGRRDKAQVVAASELADDPFNMTLLYEQARIIGEYALWKSRMSRDEYAYHQVAADYWAMGSYDRVVEVLGHCVESCASSPLAYYMLCDAHVRLADPTRANAYHQHALQADVTGCFPNTLYHLQVLQAVAEYFPDDPRVRYLLGNLWFDRRQYDLAIACWEQAGALDGSFPTAWRNLGLAYFNKRGDAEAAWEALETAFTLDKNDARVLYELDQLAKRLAHSPGDRLERLMAYREVVFRRDDLTLELLTLLNQVGEHRQALEILLARNWHPWEGGEGKVSGQFVLAITQLARTAVAEGDFAKAIELLERTFVWPANLGEGKLAGIQENDIHYLLGLAHAGAGHTELAGKFWETASQGLTEPTSAIYYNDQPPDTIFYQGMALTALGRGQEASDRFERLIDYGKKARSKQVEIDYFAVSLPDFLVFEADIQQQHEIHCDYMQALGHLGLSHLEEASALFADILARQPHHAGAAVHGNWESAVSASRS